MNTKHTPGPWHVLEVVSGPIWVMGPGPNPVYIARLGHGSLAPRPEELADARLLATAPKLLEACKAMRTRIAMLEDPSCTWSTWVKAPDVDAAIAKAEGGTG